MQKYGTTKVSFHIIQEAFDHLTHHAILGPKLQGKFLSTKTFVEAMKKARFFSDEHAAIIDVKIFNSAMAKSKKWGTSMCCFDGTNKTNIWRVSYNRMRIYMVSEPCKQVQYPAAVNAMWFKEVCRSETGILRRTGSATKASIGQDSSEEELSEHFSISENLSREEYVDRQQNIPEEADQQQNISEEIGDDATAATMGDASSLSVYWDSTNAKNLFGAHPDDRNAYVTLKRKIQKLKVGNQTSEGYKDLVHGNNPNDACTPYQIYEICQQ